LSSKLQLSELTHVIVSTSCGVQVPALQVQ